ncbi:hypothetical protein [Burkholderia multivorans]|uniref:hypothetical protein n=1 Tax=Burkholderia multivorans TaxID=87883 RepID=UPI0021590C13|nr:hypothetical protein [Burkholderia multivorans]
MDANAHTRRRQTKRNGRWRTQFAAARFSLARHKKSETKPRLIQEKLKVELRLHFFWNRHIKPVRHRFKTTSTKQTPRGHAHELVALVVRHQDRRVFFDSSRQAVVSPARPGAAARAPRADACAIAAGKAVVGIEKKSREMQ